MSPLQWPPMVTRNLCTQQRTIECGGFIVQTLKDKQVDFSPLQRPPCGWLTGLLDLRASWPDCRRSGIYVGLISRKHAAANFPNELHSYQKFLYHCRCVFSRFSLYIFFRLRTSPPAPTRAIQFLFIAPPPPLQKPTQLSTPPHISSLAIKNPFLPRCCPNSSPFLSPFPHPLPTTSLSPPFGFN